MTTTLRPARAGDLAAIADIYNYYVTHSTCTFDTEPPGGDHWQRWLVDHVGPHPAIVAERDGQVVGYASLSRWNNRCAYRHSVEDSVYVRTGLHRQGIGRLLLTELVRLAGAQGHRNVVAQIVQDQPASEALHALLGFRKAGTLQGIGYKFDRWLDVHIWQFSLAS